MDNEIKDAALRHVTIVNGNNSCYDSFIAGVEWLLNKDISNDFLRVNDIFVVKNDAYICSTIDHENKSITGRCITSFTTWQIEQDFHFDEVTEKYFKA